MVLIDQPSLKMDIGALATRLCIAIVISVINLSCESAANGPGFVSIDCGGNSTYSDVNGILWTPDSDTIGMDGEVFSVSPPAYARLDKTPLSSIRFFQGNQSKYCYVFDEGIVQGKAYLVRASFWAGSQLPYPTKVANSVSFKLLIYADEWDTVLITFPQTSREVNKEIFVLAMRENIEVCLSGSSNSNSDVPFISSLVLRPLSDTLHAILCSVTYHKSRPLMTVSRKNYGAPDPSYYVRYSEGQPAGYADIYDRIWEPDTEGTRLVTHHNISVYSTKDWVPIAVMQTARSENTTFKLHFEVAPFSWYFFHQYMAEISADVNAPGQRVFSIEDSNGSYSVGPDDYSFDLYNDYGSYEPALSYVSPGFYIEDPVLDIQLIKNDSSNKGPLINAIEMFRVFDKNLSLGTIDDEVSIVKKITDNFGSLRTWKGDPCLPYPYNWISCTSEKRPSITEILAGNEDVCAAENAKRFCNARDKGNKHVLAFIAAGVAAVLLVFLILFIVWRYTKARKRNHSNSDEGSKRDWVELSYESSDARKISYKDIQTMTNNFENEIGRGGFGPVYRAAFKNGVAAAVKVLSTESAQGIKEFLNEVRLLSRVHHTHLVKLLGYCNEPDLMLVYEYMANGSLFDSLHGRAKPLSLWKDRLRVVAEASEGLEYLHGGCDPPIIHRDVKSNNILLNGNLCAKVSDFGISKSRNVKHLSMTTNDSGTLQSNKLQQLSTTGIGTFTVVRGTPGYIDPLYVETSVPDASVDVYAFGVVLFEIITGKNPITEDEANGGKHVHIVDWAKWYIERGELSAIIDPRMSNILNLNTVWMVVDLALKCVDMNKSNRPNMSTLKQELKLALSMELNEGPSTTESLDNLKTYEVEPIMRIR